MSEHKITPNETYVQQVRLNNIGGYGIPLRRVRSVLDSRTIEVDNGNRLMRLTCRGVWDKRTWKQVWATPETRIKFSSCMLVFVLAGDEWSAKSLPDADTRSADWILSEVTFGLQDPNAVKYVERVKAYMQSLPCSTISQVEMWQEDAAHAGDVVPCARYRDIWQTQDPLMYKIRRIVASACTTIHQAWYDVYPQLPKPLYECIRIDKRSMKPRRCSR